MRGGCFAAQQYSLFFFGGGGIAFPERQWMVLLILYSLHPKSIFTVPCSLRFEHSIFSFLALWACIWLGCLAVCLVWHTVSEFALKSLGCEDGGTPRRAMDRAWPGAESTRALSISSYGPIHMDEEMEDEKQQRRAMDLSSRSKQRSTTASMSGDRLYWLAGS